MKSKPEPFRKCQAHGCFRHADPDWAYCRDHAEQVLGDAIRRAREWGLDTSAHDPADGGHNERGDGS